MLLDSSSIILQKNHDEDGIFVMKFHRLDCPNIRISSCLNGEVQRDEVLHLKEAFPILVLMVGNFLTNN